MMKLPFRFVFRGWVMLFVLSGSISAMGAGLEWQVEKEASLDAQPSGLAVSPDGKWIFVLMPGEIQVHSPSNGEIITRIPIDRSYDRLAYSPKESELVLTSTTGKKLQIIRLDPVYDIDISGLPFKGPQNAPVTVAVFSDYQCPYCVGLDPLLKRMLDQNPKTVKLVFLNFPLSSHKVAIPAAQAALAAHKQGKFWEFHEKLHENYRDLNVKKILAFAEEMKLDMDRFKKDMSATSITNLIKRDIQTGREIDIRGIPSVFINGKALKERSPEGLQEMIDKEMKKASR